MKKILLLFIVPFSLVANSLDEVKSTLISKIADALVDKKVVRIYVNDDAYTMLKKFPYRFEVIEDCSQADMIITSESSPTQCNKSDALVLMTRYREFTQNKEAVGALFWQKGRPNLIFDKRRLQELSLSLPHAFSKYIE